MNRDITLGERVFSIPRLPLVVSREVYPKCVTLTKAGIINRYIEAKGVVDVSREEFDLMAEIAFLAARLAEPTLTQEEFDALPIMPQELLDAFFVIRWQTGMWKPPEKVVEDGDDVGEEAGLLKSPLTSTSTESLESSSASSISQ